MAAKKSHTKSKKSTSKVKVLTSKSEFIRQNSKLPVKEIIAKAAKAGVGDISAAFCYTILSEFRKRQGKAPKKAAGEHEVGNGRTAVGKPVDPRKFEQPEATRWWPRAA